MRCTVIFRERVAAFFLKKMSFLSELQPDNTVFIIAVVLCDTSSFRITEM